MPMQAPTTIAIRCRFCDEAGLVAPALFLLGRDPGAVETMVVLRPLGRAPSRADAQVAASLPATERAEARVRHLVPNPSRTEWGEWAYISPQSMSDPRAVTELGIRRSSSCPRCRRSIQFTLRQLVRLIQVAEAEHDDSILVPPRSRPRVDGLTDGLTAARYCTPMHSLAD